MADKLPWFPMFASDYEGDERVRLMSLEAEGVYNALLRHQWFNGSIPADDEALRQLLKPHRPESLNAAKQCFVLLEADASRMSNQKLARVMVEQQKKHSAKVRAGRKGGINSGVTRRSKASSSARSKASSKREATEQNRTEQITTENNNNIVAAPRRRSGTPTWLTPFWETWQDRYDGDPPAGPLAKALKPLVDKHGSEVVAAAWARYVAETEAEYASPSRFASTFGNWSGTATPSRKATVAERTFQKALKVLGEAS